MFNDDKKALKKITSFATINYINNQNQSSFECLSSTLDTLCDLNYKDLNIDTIYLLKSLYNYNKNLFSYKQQSYLEGLFSITLKNSLDIKKIEIQKEVREIEKNLEATSNIFNQI